MDRLVLNIEGEPSIQNPTPQDVCAAVDRMTPHGGPGFVILEGRGDDYAQTAGGDGAFVVEWREDGEPYRHLRAGLPGQPAEGKVAIPTNGFQVTVRPNERLTASDAKAILLAYLAGQMPPRGYAWREISKELP